MEYSIWPLLLTHGVDYVELHVAPTNLPIECSIWQKKGGPNRELHTAAQIWSMEYSMGPLWSDHFRHPLQTPLQPPPNPPDNSSGYIWTIPLESCPPTLILGQYHWKNCPEACDTPEFETHKRTSCKYNIGDRTLLTPFQQRARSHEPAAIEVSPTPKRLFWRKATYYTQRSRILLPRQHLLQEFYS